MAQSPLRYLPLAREAQAEAARQQVELAKYQALAQQSIRQNLYLDFFRSAPQTPEPAAKPEPPDPPDPAAARFSKLQLD